MIITSSFFWWGWGVGVGGTMCNIFWILQEKVGEIASWLALERRLIRILVDLTEGMEKSGKK